MAIAAWGLVFMLAIWRLILTVLVIEVHRRCRVHQALAATFVDDPLPACIESPPGAT
ncbi:MAG: hypothetical protein ACYDES_06950 [Acidimicrobiales bacterium]